MSITLVLNNQHVSTGIDGYIDTTSGSLTVDAGGFITGLGARGAWLQTGGYSVSINGSVYGANGNGLDVSETTLGTKSSVAVGASGAVHGRSTVSDAAGLSMAHGGVIRNAGSITAEAPAGTAVGVDVLTFKGAVSITNSGTITAGVGGVSSIGLRSAAATTLTNTGTIFGFDRSIVLTTNSGTIKNSGTISGQVEFSSDTDTFTDFIGRKHGHVNGDIDMGGGDDIFVGGKFDETVRDGDGFDIYRLGGGADTVKLYSGLTFDTATDQFDGGAGSDWIDATNYTVGGLKINLDSAAHSLPSWTTAGAQLIQGTDTDRVIGFENVRATNSDDVILGNSAVNTIEARSGADIIETYAGNDTIFAGDGADSITGGLGADQIYLGASDASADTVFYNSIAESGTKTATRDVIHDFEVGIDKIDLFVLDANTKNGTATNEAFNYLGMFQNFTSAGAASAGELRANWVGGNTVVEGDVNGDGRADFSIVLEGNLTISASDFIL
jgi:Peptidase M10 serralysin C terminal